MAPSKKTPSTVRYVDPNARPRQFDQADYRAIESVVGSISGLGDPVVVTGVFPAWQDVKAAVLYRTERYDIYLVRDNQGRWFLSEITDVPIP